MSYYSKMADVRTVVSNTLLGKTFLMNKSKMLKLLEEYAFMFSC